MLQSWIVEHIPVPVRRTGTHEKNVSVLVIFFLDIWSSIFIWCSLVTCQSKYYNRKAIKAIGFFTDSGHTSEVFLVYWNYQGGLKGHKRPRDDDEERSSFFTAGFGQTLGFAGCSALSLSFEDSISFCCKHHNFCGGWHDLEWGYQPSFQPKLLYWRGYGIVILGYYLV